MMVARTALWMALGIGISAIAWGCAVEDDDIDAEGAALRKCNGGGRRCDAGAADGATSDAGTSQDAAIGSPDLVVTQIQLSQAAPNVGDAVTFTATVKNQGTGPTPAGTTVGVLFSVDGAPVAWSDTFNQAIAAGATVTLTANGGPNGAATWTATSGSHQVVAFVDDINRIPNEVSESNNTLT
jgi:hypothetical protein